MIRLGLAVILTSLTLSLTTAGVTPAAAAPLSWHSWSDTLFDRAAREKRFVLLDLEAVWCHWCHVMEETTYRDPQVVALLAARFIPVRVDQDSRPDLSNRYEDYGWPATVIFGPDGQELVKFSGYIPPARMASLLRGVIDDPTPGPSVAATRASTTATAGEAALPEGLRAELSQALIDRYDSGQGGWGRVHKFLDADAVEYSIALAREGDRGAEARARETLLKQRKLLDPVWGGVYQYSDSGDWDHPHFEKIMAMQADNLRLYALAYAQWQDPTYLEAARAIHRYLRTFLRSPLGAFYNSQDADVVPGRHSGEYFGLGDAERRARGIPRVDTHLYARENAWVVNALLALHGATGDASVLQEAAAVAEWLVAQRGLPEGGFRHDAKDPAGPYLGDTVASGRAFLSLYAATADRTWLRHAQAAAVFIDTHFRVAGVPGLVTAAPRGGLHPPAPQRDENIAVARFTNLLWRYTGAADHRRLAEEAMRYLATPTVARRFETAGPLLADRELRTEPIHLTVVGRRDDPSARALLSAALAYPSGFRRVELWDRREGPLPGAAVDYPDLPRAAAFVCTENRCSAPSYTADELRSRVERLERPLTNPGPSK